MREAPVLGARWRWLSTPRPSDLHALEVQRPSVITGEAAPQRPEFRDYRYGWMPGGHTIRSKPLGEPSELRPGTRWQPPGIVTHPDLVHAICPCPPASRWRGSRAFVAIGRARMMVATSKAVGMIVRPAIYQTQDT